MLSPNIGITRRVKYDGGATPGEVLGSKLSKNKKGKLFAEYMTSAKKTSEEKRRKGLLRPSSKLLHSTNGPPHKFELDSTPLLQ